ncbi:MAG: hypothetical protein J0L97_00815 [Alphaproteobacteria bacterium]|nr:hypothetical protein [Alphaproteobacteria bacterium]
MLAEVSSEEIRRLVREAVLETLSNLGFDTREMQEVQADMLHLRRVRKGSEEMLRGVRASAAAVMVSTGLYLLWVAVKLMVGKE